jgi:hypothetical protein
MPADTSDAGAPQGLSWSWGLDFDALVASLGEAADVGDLGNHGNVDDRSGERIPAGALSGRVAERLAPGPDLVAWLAMAEAPGLDDADLAAVAGSWRRVASWAQAQELAAVAQIASRAAARDEDVGTDADGRPARIPATAAAEVALELTMSQYGAAWWADLAVQLCWRLSATGAALAAGSIDLQRARLIAEATGRLSDEAARAVEERVLPAAREQTTGMLRAALRRAVIAADPAGAERRREEAERQAKVSLYPDEETTATLAGQRLPGVHAAAAMARIKAMARAWKASGASGGIDLLCAKIYLGLLLGTLPLIPPAEGAPPDDPPSDDPPSDDPGGEPPAEDPADHPRGDGPGEDPGAGPGGKPPAEDSADHPRGDGPGEDPGAGRGGEPPGDGSGAPRDDEPGDGMPGGEVPPPGDQDAPRGEDDCPCPDDCPAGDNGDRPGENGDDGWPGDGRAPEWPGLPAVIPSAFARPQDGRPAAGLLDILLPWEVLAGIDPGPGYLGRIGPVTGLQARCLAGCAARDPAAEWRIIVTDRDGHALAVTRLRRPRGRAGPAPPGDRAGGAGNRHRPGAGIGLVARVTLTIPEYLLTDPPAHRDCSDGLGLPGAGWIVDQALGAAVSAAAGARATAAASAAAGGCVHDAASPGYRPPPRLREHVIARDVTCRFPRCRQPAWRGDLDHTVPFDDGGLTCRCNLGGLCRAHHNLKQHPAWKLEQTAPGTFTWTTSAGRTFVVTPDLHPV